MRYIPYKEKGVVLIFALSIMAMMMSVAILMATHFRLLLIETKRVQQAYQSITVHANAAIHSKKHV